MRSEKKSTLVAASACMVLLIANVMQEAAKAQEPSAPSADSGSESSLRKVLKTLIPGLGDSSSESGEIDSTQVLAEALSEEELKRTLPWASPDYSNQQGMLGWSSDVFDVPPAMKDRVAFWRDIYSKYTTEQGVLHDSVNVGIVYAPIDFGSIQRDSSLTPRGKAKARENLLESKRSEIQARLLRLHGKTTADGLTGEDLRVWRMFESKNDPGKFLTAAEKGRVRFQLGQKDRFVLGIYYSGRYLREMEKIFKDEGLPVELTRLPFVESSFNINARSKVGASGIWQFMPRTARPYMMVNKDVDERNDPLASTRASARLLKQNYQMLQAWPLAVTGYNHGAYGVKRIVEKLGTRDLAEIVERYSSRTFGFASENFYACFLAALDVERNARQFLGDVRWSAADENAELKVTRSLPWSSVLAFFNGDEKLATLTNPHFTSRVRDGKSSLPKGTLLRVPQSRLAVAKQLMSGAINPANLASALQDAPIKKIETVPLPSPSQAVTAVAAETSAQPTPAVDPIDDLVKNPIQTVNQQTSPPKAQSQPQPQPRAAIAAAVASQAKTHKVRRGDTLIMIAKRYGVELDELKQLNGFSADPAPRKKSRAARREMIRAGQVIKIPDAKSP